MSSSFSIRRLLVPLVPAYSLVLLLREFGLRLGLEPVRRLRWPVVSIGNLSMGGSGKTPLTIALARALARRGCSVDVLSRGYGRQSKLAGRVRPEGAAEDFGDEPLLITRATDLPVYVAGQRYQAGLLAECDGCADTSRAVHLLDDGFQHRQLHRDVDILLLDQRDWQEGMHLAGLLPAGNLREPLQAARRATVIAIPAGEPELEAALRAWGWQGPLWPLRRTMKFPSVDGPVAAFCGIARPEQFFDGLEAGGMNLAARFAFADHHSFTISDLKRLTTAARAAGATALLTTRKDRFRLGELAQALPESLPLMTIGLRIEIENEDAAIDWLMERVMSAR